MSQYTEQAETFLKSHNLEFRAVLVGNDCPPFCEDAQADRDTDKTNTFPRRTHIHGKHYRCTVSGKERGHVSFDFWNSYADEEYNALGTKSHRLGETVFKFGERLRDGQQVRLATKGRTVAAYDLLACIQKRDPGTFEDFCGDFGYDTDSRRADTTHQAVRQEWQKVRRFFTQDEIRELQEIS